jgi:hypothetical protein
VNGTNSELVAFENADSTVNTPVTASAFAPGKTFLAANARGVRCIAACLKVTYAGSESSRAGRVHYGHTSAGMIDVGASLAADNVAQTLQHYSRTPANTIELRWFPGAGDFEFNDPSESAGAIMRDRKTSLTFAWAGIPAGVSLTFHFTAVYEWRPAVGQGIGTNALGKSISRNTFDNVLDHLIRMGETFVGHAGAAAGGVLASRVSSAFGLMPALPMRRNMIAFG